MERTDRDPLDITLEASATEAADLSQLDAAFSAVFAGQERILWEGKFWGGSDQRIIGYGTYTYVPSSGKVVEYFVVGLARQKNYLSVYINAVEDGRYLTEVYADRLGSATVGKSSISFTSLDDVELDVLVEMATRARDLVDAAK